MRIGAVVGSEERRSLMRRLGLDCEIGSSQAIGYRLFGAWGEDDLLGASAWFPAADGSAMLMRPWTDSTVAAVAADLYLAMASDAREAGCRYALALTDPDDPRNEESLAAAQFSRLSEFTALSRRLDRQDRGPPEWDGSFVEFADDVRERFHDLFSTIQRDSHDCLGLRGLRSSEEAFAMFAAAGRFRPEDWLLLERDSRDAALLLLNEAADGAAGEIAYLGVAPELRHRGIGRGLVAEAIRRVALRDFPKIVTAVDRANIAASRLYDHFGFLEMSRHQVFFKHLPTGTQGARPGS